MNTNYTVTDGLSGRVGFEAAKTDLIAGLLLKDPQLENAFAMVRVETRPVELLHIGIGATIHAIVPVGTSRQDRLTVFTSTKPGNHFRGYAEVGITELSNAGDNTWIMAGLAVPGGRILDQIGFETEIKPKRPGAGDEDTFAWILLLAKSIKDTKFNLNIGADPSELDSENALDIGVILRVTTKF